MVSQNNGSCVSLMFTDVFEKYEAQIRVPGRVQ